jgi:pyruvate ferredoxin oxidoreductase delta subunit
MEDKCKPNILHIYDGKIVKPFEAGKPGWADIPQGAVITEAGNGRKYNTGYWRSDRAVFVPERCIQCLRCWVCCPDVAWKVKDGKVTGIDYKYCKGCGICDRQCPVDAIYMMDEEEAIEKLNTKGHAPAYSDTPEFWPKMGKNKKTD